MFKSLTKTMAKKLKAFGSYPLIWCIFLVLPNYTWAADQDPDWQSWLLNQVEQHQEIIAAHQKLKSQQSQTIASNQPIYNPEFSAEYEREGDDNNFNAGISQTLDIWNKRHTKAKQGGYAQVLAEYDLDILIQQKLANALNAIISWQSAKDQARLAKEQEKQMVILLDLIEQRQQVGDLELLAVELTYLSLAQRLNDSAKAHANLAQISADLEEIIPSWPSKKTTPRQIFADFTADLNSGDWLDKHPIVKAAQTRWQAAKKAAILVSLEGRGDPSLNLRAGKSGEDAVFTVSISMPLNFRHTYKAEAKAASTNTLVAQAEYLAIRRQLELASKASLTTLQEYQQRYDQYQRIMAGRRARTKNLLENKWASGDLDTAEYLMGLAQQSAGLLAGIELEGDFYLAQIDWLLQTGQIRKIFGQQ